MSASDLLLGKNPARLYYAERRVKLADFLDHEKAEYEAKGSQTWGGGIHFGMYLNDQKPDCTCASIGHAEQIHSTRTGHAEHPTDGHVQDLFHRTGVQQGLTDNDGRFMDKVLELLATEGMLQADGSYEKIVGWAAVNWHNHTEVKLANQFFGGSYVGVSLPLSAADQIDVSHSWTVVDDPSRNVPGSWGGHAMWQTGFNTRGPRSVTWARAQQWSWQWSDKYTDEHYVVVTHDWVQNPTAPSGLDVDGLLHLMETLNA